MTNANEAPAVSVEAVDKTFGHRAVLRGATLALVAGEVAVLTGSSGSGKTTLLRIIAGLDAPDAGQVWVGDTLASDGHRLKLAPHERGIGMVFQEPALWPHMTVLEHTTFGLVGMNRAEAEVRAEEVMEMTEITALARARPAELSGGEAARVALARTLAPRPRVLLLDEPLAHLHPSLREDLAGTIGTITRATRAATLVITHSPADLAGSDVRALHLDGGQIG